MAFTQLPGRLVPSSTTFLGQYGVSAALSADGAVLAIGEPGHNGNRGRVLVYDFNGTSYDLRGVVQSPSPQSGEKFGSSVALSGSGQMLAVGAPNYDGPSLNDSGAVYIFDWTTSWVMRGARVTTPSPLNNDVFGTGVALSSSGAILAVGCNRYGAMLYDWSGSAWVYRGAILPTSNIKFGTGIALSANGLIMAVGAPEYSSTPDSQNGALWVYDWSGSAWVQRGSTMLSPEPAETGLFGISVALSSTGALMIVGVMKWTGVTDWRGAAYVMAWDAGLSQWVESQTKLQSSDAAADMETGRGVALSGNGLTLALGAPGYNGGQTSSGAAHVFTAPDDTAISIPTRLVVSAPTGSISIPTALVVAATGPVSVATALVVAPGSAAASSWTVRCLIDGVDVSATLTGRVSVQASEGAARLAQLTINPPSGTLAPLDYVGKPILIDYVPMLSGVGVPLRIFTGRIDTPSYNFVERALELTCTDDLQNRIAALPVATLDLLIGGRYAESVQGEILDNFDYAQARLTTVPASLDASAQGGLRVTAWSSASVWKTFGAGDLIYPDVAIQYPQRSGIINEVACEFDYRYARLRQRYTTLGWSGTQIDIAPAGWQYPTQQDILGAAGGSGWTVTHALFTNAPAAIPHSSGGFIVPADGSIDMAILHLTQRHSQTVTERYALTVRAQESIDANGTLPFALRGALESAFDGNAWESALDVAPLMPTGGEMDYAPDASRTDADAAIQTLLDQANVKILGSHRSTRVSVLAPCDPSIDLDKRVRIDMPHIVAEAKVAEIEHMLDLDAGAATTRFSIAPFGAGGAGIITPDTLAPPSAPAPAVETQDWAAQAPSLYVNVYGITPYSDALMGLILNPPESIVVENVPPGGDSQTFANPHYVAGSYPVQGFRVQMPGVDDADRNPIEKPASATYGIVIPVDPFTISQP